MTKLFQITEADLSTLEAALPRLQDALGEAMNRSDVQVAIGEGKEILSNVRWNYGPYQEVKQA